MLLVSGEAAHSNTFTNPETTSTTQQTVKDVLLNPARIKPKGRPQKIKNSRRLMPTAEIARMKSKVTCSHCGEQDHYKTTCTKLHIDFPPRRKARIQKNKENEEQISNNTRKAV
jgi:hypothetical protein